MKCNICNSNSELLFKKTILNTHSVGYHKCQNCGFLQTDKPFWLDEAYASAISDMDTGILYRNQENVKVTKKIISTFLHANQMFLDYGGGYGTFTRLMRDIGYNYHTYDIFCNSIFSKHFEFDKLTSDNHFELITAFELFEHVEAPINKLKEMLQFSDNILISTSLQPSNKSELENWNYLVTEGGQHISFYTLDSLKFMAAKLGVNLVSNNNNYHLFSKSKINSILFRLICSSKTNKFIPSKRNRKSFIFEDFESIRQSKSD